MMILTLLCVADPSSTGQAQSGSGADDELVAQAQTDPRAFAPIYERYLGRIYRYCYSRLGSREAAEDATAEVFLKALANLRQYRGGVFAAWLYTIARNTVTDHLRRRHPTEALENTDGVLATAAAPAVEDERAALLAALAELPEEQRTVLELQFAGWSGNEIAAALGKSPAATRMIRYRAVQRLQKLLGATGNA